jgi:hypothetical protein
MAEAVRQWLTGLGAKTAFVGPESPRKNGHIELFKEKLGLNLR